MSAVPWFTEEPDEDEELAPVQDERDAARTAPGTRVRGAADVDGIGAPNASSGPRKRLRSVPPAPDVTVAVDVAARRVFLLPPPPVIDEVTIPAGYRVAKLRPTPPIDEIVKHPEVLEIFRDDAQRFRAMGYTRRA